MHKQIDETMIRELREKVSSFLSQKRFCHTLGVERMALKIGNELALDSHELVMLRCAAILHDVTKEYSFEKQLKICCEFGIILRSDEVACPQILHSITAAAIIPSDYPYFNHPEIISAVRWHTTGHREMSVLDKIICLSDFIEDGREYAICTRIRNDFWSKIIECNTTKAKLLCLDKALKASLEATVSNVEEKGGTVNFDTIDAIEVLSLSH